MKQISLLTLLFAALWTTALAAEPVSRIAAVVNTDIITTYQLEQTLAEHLAKQANSPTAEQLVTLRRQLLQRLIEESLVKQRIKELKLTVSEEEIETAILDVQKQNRLTREQLQQAVLNQGITFESYRDNLRQQILRYKLIGADVRSKVEVTEQEIVEYYRAHLDEYRSPERVALSVLSFPLPVKGDSFQKEAIEVAAREATDRLRQGEPLDNVADAYRNDYAVDSTSIRAMSTVEMSPEFAKALEGVEIGGYSDPVLSGPALHVLRLDERTSGGLRPFDSAKGEIHQLISDQKTDAQIKEWTRTLERKAFIDIRL
ncbi:MAG: SurA N-terminal domain-containing protein [Desulfuromonadales bacterium]|nr:SurA N-terminal domain-containing protein [Desulfuromonadales bacterium]